MSIRKENAGSQTFLSARGISITLLIKTNPFLRDGNKSPVKAQPFRFWAYKWSDILEIQYQQKHQRGLSNKANTSSLLWVIVDYCT